MHYFPFYIFNSAFVTQLAVGKEQLANSSWQKKQMHYFPFYILNSAFVTQLAVGKEQLAKKTNVIFFIRNSSLEIGNSLFPLLPFSPSISLLVPNSLSLPICLSLCAKP